MNTVRTGRRRHGRSVKKLRFSGLESYRCSARRNSYILEPSLILFSLVLLFSSYLALVIQNRAALVAASDRSTADLLMIDRAKAFAGERSWSRRCQTIAPAQAFHETVAGKNVLFKDESTRIVITYEDRGQKFKMYLYYDDNGILSVEYD